MDNSFLLRVFTSIKRGDVDGVFPASPNLRPFAVLDGVEPGAQGPGRAGGLGRGQDEGSADEAVALLANVARPEAIRAGVDARREAPIAGQVLGTQVLGTGGEALEVAEFEDQKDGDERADAGDRPQPLDSGVLAPALLKVLRNKQLLPAFSRDVFGTFSPMGRGAFKRLRLRR